MSKKKKIDCQSQSIDCGQLGEALFNLSSILIYASMTMRARLRGAVDGSPARLRTCEALYLQMWAAEKGGSEPGLISQSALALMQTDGINRYIFIPLSLANPASIDVLSGGWNNIFFCFFVPFSQRHSISRTPEAESCLSWAAPDNLCPGSRGVCITLLDRIQRFNPIVNQLRYFNSTLSPINAA